MQKLKTASANTQIPRIPTITTAAVGKKKNKPKDKADKKKPKRAAKTLGALLTIFSGKRVSL